MAIPGDMEGGRRPKGAFANADSVADRAHTYESRAGAVLDMDSCLDSCMMHYILYMSSYISHYIDPYISPYMQSPGHRPHTGSLHSSPEPSLRSPIPFNHLLLCPLAGESDSLDGLLIMGRTPLIGEDRPHTYGGRRSCNMPRQTVCCLLKSGGGICSAPRNPMKTWRVPNRNSRVRYMYAGTSK